MSKTTSNLAHERNAWHDRAVDAEAELKQLRENYEAMRLEWSKSVDERDDALAEVKRLRLELRDLHRDYKAAAEERTELRALLKQAHDRDRVEDRS